MATYRIEVGKRHKVEPRQIVGAIANEGGLGRGDFGHIDIRADHSFVELPADLSAARRSGPWRGPASPGKLIALSPEGPPPPPRGRSDEGPTRPSGKKPRHKKTRS